MDRTSTTNVKPYYDATMCRTPLAPLSQTQQHMQQTWSGQEFKSPYMAQVIPAIVPLNFTGIKNIQPPSDGTMIHKPLHRFDPSGHGVPIMETLLMPRAFCPIL